MEVSSLLPKSQYISTKNPLLSPCGCILIIRWCFSSGPGRHGAAGFFTVSSHSEQKQNTNLLYDKNHQRNTDSKKPIILLI